MSYGLQITSQSHKPMTLPIVVSNWVISGRYFNFIWYVKVKILKDGAHFPRKKVYTRAVDPLLCTLISNILYC